MEEYASGERSAFWLIREIFSAVRRPRTHETLHERRAQMLSNVWTDTRYALRTFRRNPGFAAAAMIPIALGIGINTGIFAILSNVALRPLPTPDSTALVTVHQDFQGVKGRRVHGARSMFSVPEYETYRDTTKTLSGIMAYTMAWTFTLGGKAPQEIEGVLVTCNYFDVLRVRPSIGAGFTQASCAAPNAAPSVILSHALWTRAFDADPDIVRKTITLDGQTVAVVGVAPEGFDGIAFTRAAFFVSTALQPDYHKNPQLSWLTMVGRRADGSGIDEVRAELAVIASRIDRLQPGRSTTLIVAPATSLSLPVERREFLAMSAIVLAAFGLVLLIACANVANVLLARAAGRTREIAIRLSVGASRWRLIRHMLTESLMIAIVGGAAGSLLTWWSFQLLLQRFLASLPGTVSQPRIDANMSLDALWFSLALTAVTALVFGLVPALQATNHDLQAVTKQNGADFAGPTRGRLRGLLIGIQVAVCMALLVSAGLLLRALHAAETTDPGFDYRNVAVVSTSFRGPGYDDARVALLRRQLREQIGNQAGIEAISLVGKTPLSPGRMQTAFRRAGEETAHDVDFNPVSPEYFSLIRIPIVQGRTFTSAELEGTPRAVIVTEATARRYWPGLDPIGRSIVLGLKTDVPLQIVGIAKDAQVSNVAQTESSYIYLPAGSTAERGLTMLVRSQGDFDTLATGIRAVTQALDPTLVVRVAPLQENLDYWRAGSRVIASLSGSLGLLALILACGGVYGVVSYVVARRRREVGIRMALGATGRDVRILILRQTLRPVAAGVLVGAIGAAAASRTLESVLFGVSPFDPVAFIGAPLFLFGAAAVATLLPLRQAMKVDPISTLRYD